MSVVVYNYTQSDLLAFSEYNISLVAVYEGDVGSQPVLLNGLMTLGGGLSLVVVHVFISKVAENLVSNLSNVIAMDAFGCYTWSQPNINLPAIIIISLYSF